MSTLTFNNLIYSLTKKLHYRVSLKKIERFLLMIRNRKYFFCCCVYTLSKMTNISTKHFVRDVIFSWMYICYKYSIYYILLVYYDFVKNWKYFEIHVFNWRIYLVQYLLLSLTENVMSMLCVTEAVYSTKTVNASSDVREEKYVSNKNITNDTWEI